MTPWNRSLPRRGFAASLALLLIPACGHPPETTKDSAAATPAAAAPARARRLAPVEVAAVASRRMTYSIDATGQLEPNEIVRVPSRVAGVLQDITFQEGTQVSPGTLLARVDPERYQLQTVRSEAALHQAEAQLKEAEAALRKRELLRAKDKGWVSDEELSNFGARGDEARATVAAAQAALDLARKDLRDSSVRSALKGVINKKLADTGQYLTAGQTIAEIVDVRRLKLSFKVAESESTRLTGTSSFSFTVKALPGQRFHARLYHIGEAADPLTRMVGCLAWVEEGTQALKPGWFADVRIATGETRSSVVVAETAVLPTDRGFVAYALMEAAAGTEATVEERRLKLGLRTREGEIEVLEGLNLGDRVVVRGAATLSDGAAVTIVASARTEGEKK